MSRTARPPYEASLPGTLLAAREAVIAPIRPILRDAKITEQQMRVLRVLENAGELDLTSLAKRALLHPPSVTRILRGMTDLGLVTRRTDEQDGRRSFVKISSAGLELVDLTGARAGKVLAHYEALFGAERLARLRDELTALTATIKSAGLDLTGGLE